MSKPESGLFHGTSGSHASSFDKKKQAIETVRRLIAEAPGGRKKSMAAGAYDLKTGKLFMNSFLHRLGTGKISIGANSSLDYPI